MFDNAFGPMVAGRYRSKLEYARRVCEVLEFVLGQDLSHVEWEGDLGSRVSREGEMVATWADGSMTRYSSDSQEYLEVATRIEPDVRAFQVYFGPRLVVERRAEAKTRSICW